MNKVLLTAVTLLLIAIIYFISSGQKESKNVIDDRSIAKQADVSIVSKGETSESAIRDETMINQPLNTDTASNLAQVELLELESEVATKNSDNNGTEIKIEAINKMTPESFDALFNEFANNDNISSEILDHKAQYENVFHRASSEQQSFTLNRLECGEAICIASVELYAGMTAKEITRIIGDTEGFDSRALSALPKGTNSGELGFIFSRGSGRAGITMPVGGRISFKENEG